MTVADALKRHARERPDHPAIEIDGNSISYEEVARRVEDSARRLADAGFKPGDLIGLRLPDSAEHLIVLFAIARLGGILMSFSPRDPDGEICRNISNLKLTTLIVDDEGTAVDGIPSVNLETVCPRAPEALLAFDGPSPGGDAPFTCGQSSGTTGQPKTILWNHSLYLRWAECHIACGKWQPSDRMALIIHLYFSYGRALAMSMLHLGGTVVFMPPSNSKAFVETINNQEATLLYLTPAHLRTILAQHPRARAVLPGLRGLFLGTAATTPAERAQARERLTANVYENYGTNETGPLAFATPSNYDAYPDSLGQMIADVEVAIIGADGEPLPAGEVGLVRFRNPAFPTAYLGNRQASEHHFRQGWFYPGDLGAVNAEGYLFLQGRADDVIDNQGAKYYPAEIENVLMAHPSVSDASVIAWEHPKHGTVAAAFVVTDGEATIELLQDHCREHLAPHKRPYLYLRMQSLPRNAMGKVLKDSLRQYLEERISSARGTP